MSKKKLQLELRYNKELGMDLAVRLALLNFEVLGVVDTLNIIYHDGDKSRERTVLMLNGGPAFHKEEGTKKILQLIIDTMDEIL